MREAGEASERQQRAFDRAVTREREAIEVHEHAAQMHEATADVLAWASLSEPDSGRSAGMALRAADERRLAATARQHAQTARDRLTAEGVAVDEQDQPERSECEVFWCAGALLV